MIFNLLIVWAATGFWHGANWNFILWGLYYFVFLVLEKVFLKKYFKKMPSVLSHIYTLLIVLVGWAIFSLDKPGEIFPYLGYMFGHAHLVSTKFFYDIKCYGLVLVSCTFASLPIGRNWFRALIDHHQRFYILKPVLVAMGLFFCIAYLVDSSYNPFLYFRF